jgi:hypothetical protein
MNNSSVLNSDGVRSDISDTDASGFYKPRDHVTPLYPQTLALTSPTSGGRSVGIVRPRTKATDFVN